LVAGTVYSGFSTEDYSGVTSEEAFMRMLAADNRVQNHAAQCVDILKAAITENYAICVDYLLQKGAPVHDPSLDKWSYLEGSQPLAIAIKNENAEIARALLKAGAAPSERQISDAGYSENPEIVRLFENYH
jgi:ankyrin repeat protein